jgi:hypothetical protein
LMLVLMRTGSGQGWDFQSPPHRCKESEKPQLKPSDRVKLGPRVARCQVEC